MIIALIVIGAVLLTFLYYWLGFDRIKRTHSEVAGLLEECLGPPEDENTNWAWDVFFNIKIKDPELEALRQRLEKMAEQFPPESSGKLMSQRLRQEILEAVKILKARTDA